jgi:hypothetical protein
MMYPYYYAGAFLLGCLVVYLLTRWRIRFLLKDELRSYRKELKKKKKWWPPEPFPMLPLLKRHKDHYKRESEHRERELEEVAMQLDQERQKLTAKTEELEELRRENRELQAIIGSSDEGSVASGGGMAPHGVVPGQARGAYPVSPGVPPQGASPGTPPGIATGQARGEVRGASSGKGAEPMTLLYFGIPDHQGNFPAGQGASVYDNRKIYMIVTRPGTDRGELHYISGELDMKAINNIDYYLVPVCEISDISVRNNATRVIQEAKGAVLLASGKWICTSRVKVKLV